MLDNPLYFILSCYTVLISLISLIATVGDKIRSKKNMWRVPEAELFIFAVLGGAAVMYLTMVLIRHKTRHLRFMLGLPLIIAMQAILFLLFEYYTCGVS